MNILIAGGAGFIGTNLCYHLLKSNDNNLYVVDNLSSGLRSNLKKLENKPNFTFYEADITESLSFLNFYEIDQIYNLACPASPFFYKKNPIATMDTCYLGTKNLLSLARTKNASFLQASTSEIYGDPNNDIQNEKYFGNVNPLGERSCYDEGKRIAESLCYEYKRQYGLNICIVRIFNTYGPYMRKDDGRVVSSFINHILQHKKIEIHGSGKQTRSFCYISDLVSGLNLVMNGKDFGPFNIGNPNEISIENLANHIKFLMQKHLPKIENIYLPKTQDDPERRKPDITKIKNKFRWKPYISLDDGLKKTIQFYEKNFKE